METALKQFILLMLLSTVGTCLTAHSGGLNRDGCHAGSKPYHCHQSAKKTPKDFSSFSILSGIVTRVRDGDTIEVDGIAVRLSALDCPENDTQRGNNATKIAKQFEGLLARCELTGANSYDRLVGYCSVNGYDFGSYMMKNSSCVVWEKYDVWNRY